MLKGIKEETQLNNVTSYILRHTACTRMAEAGVDLKVIQGIMGHKHIDTTMDIYNHVNVQRMNQESKKMNDIVTLDFTTAAVI
ncbi:MAG: tyrosine-type recombinase/integrase [Alphaproteobacteria bacterium]|nr:tyrosine-type recombinase/integrase [Alphaproteobacteria bacterium]